MAKDQKETTVLFNFDKKLDIKGDKTGNMIFAIPFDCTDQDGEASSYVSIYRANSLNECISLGKEECGSDMFDNKVNIGTPLLIGKIS